jgi:D-glycero-D-manno-heptose 1,7-bisphosphate phosphatase
MYRAIFLDRDGVINKSVVIRGKPYPPSSIDEVEIHETVVETLIELKSKGYMLIVVTNQPDVARGTAKKEVVEEINNYLMSSLPIDEIFTCYHDSNHDCNCRKPKPGSLVDASIKYKIDLQKSYMVGDRWRDIDAGISAGCKTVFVDYDYDEKKPSSYDFKISKLSELINIVK